MNLFDSSLLGLIIWSSRCWALQHCRTNSLHNQVATERRQLLKNVLLSTAFPSLVTRIPAPSWAGESAEIFKREASDFAYSITTPPNFKQTQKPVKTHLDEVNFISESVKGYQFGVTVDPVRIDSLKQFGSPEEVAARVVTAEVNRDGVFEVTLVEDPYESEDGAYVLEYLSSGKRGNKHFVTKIFIAQNKLFVLTAQVLEQDYRSQRLELRETVKTFHV